jgi:hypothetical protein
MMEDERENATQNHPIATISGSDTQVRNLDCSGVAISSYPSTSRKLDFLIDSIRMLEALQLSHFGRYI